MNKKSVEKLRQMRRSAEHAIETYLGKPAPLETYDALSIENDYTKQLTARVRQKKFKLKTGDFMI